LGRIFVSPGADIECELLDGRRRAAHYGRSDFRNDRFGWIACWHRWDRDDRLWPRDIRDFHFASALTHDPARNRRSDKQSRGDGQHPPADAPPPIALNLRVPERLQPRDPFRRRHHTQGIANQLVEIRAIHF
jgi:hypothetical protein